ncbi:DENN (AEX-3) domain protein (macronuclear) [Tetrahymena thermophila SB210]|uniref:DENN (AEX-3) domain protein n=1 Tax=Tetrahymena thermophila (strain SB210) TaxID=312017 RepID=I7M313_TETTS|nr:DENN (AEX-3) domain protein [Tetrahymena thermophila SB210]EAS01949.2 DENN (AEX-3) domain protein [Tetrahymena thermophila SB210]|eukprot:XP_001022194.2 DENN (AEX-3) domain protein [Tetrahymena thermophila SB210]
MSQFQSKSNNEEIYKLVEALKQSKNFNQQLQQKNEELKQDLSKVQLSKESYKKQCEDQKKTIKLLQEQNKQLQYKLSQQDKVIHNLQEECKNVLSMNSSKIGNQQNSLLVHDHQQSENVQDEQNTDNHINQAKNFESTKPLFNKNSIIQNDSKLNFVQMPVSTIYVDGQNQNAISNQLYSMQEQSKGNVNSESQASQRNMFTFSKAIPNLENQSTADSVNNTDNKLTYISPYSAPQVQINLFPNDTQSNKQRSNDKLQLNESNLSVSSSRFDHSPNNRYNGASNFKNIQKKYEQNFLKISQNSNIFSSSQNSSPINKQTQSAGNTDYNNINIDNNIIQKQKGKEGSLQLSNNKIHENEPNYTDDEDEDSDDQQNSGNREEDDFDENSSYTNINNNNKSLITSKQTPKEFEIKQNMIMNTSNHSNSFNNQDTTRLTNSYVLNDDSNQNEPIFHQPKQMTFGITESPQLNYFRQELKGQTAQFIDPKSQLYGELNQDSAVNNQPQSNYQYDKQSNKNNNQKIFNNQNQYHHRNQTLQEQQKIQEKQQNLTTSQTKTRKIFEQFPQMHYSNSMNQINNQQVQISQNSQVQQIQQGIPNKIFNQDNSISQSQISFNNQNQFYSTQHQQINLKNSQNLLQDNDHSQHSAFFEVGSIIFNDNKSEKQHSQVIYSSEQKQSELQGGQIKHIQARRLNTQDYMQSQISNLDGYQSNLKELYPQKILNMQNYAFKASNQITFQNQNNFINDNFQNNNQINIYEPDSNFSSGLGSKIAIQQFNDANDKSKFYGSCNIQSSIESTSINESIQKVQKVQIKSPKNMMDISKKFQNQDKGYSDYLNEEFVSKNNLMENFFILSANQTQIKERVMTTNEVQVVKAETIYSYPKLNEQTRQIEETVHQLSFPYGVFIKQKQKTQSQSDLLQILMHDKNNMSSDQFVFTIKTIQSYEKYDNSNKNSISTQKDIVDVANPSNLLYCICVQQKTFIDFKDPKQQSKSQKKLKKEFYYEVESVYCIVTKFPHIQFYLEVIENILSMVKVVKSQKLYSVNPYDMDLFFYKNLQSEIEAKLATLLHTKIPLFKTGRFSLPKLELDQKHVNLYMQDAEYCQYLECQWGLLDCLKKFKDIKYFVKLYISLLLERSVVFVSMSRSVLSQFILLFHSILKPLKWTHAMITTLPKSLFDYLHSPTPIIIGINDTKQNLESNQFKEKFSDSFNIVYLDDMSFSFMNDLVFEENSDFICILNMELEGQFEKLQAKTLTPRNKTSFDHQIDERKNQEEVANNILRLTKQLFLDHIVQHIPKQPIFKNGYQNKNLDYSLIHEEIINSKNNPDSFLQEFFKTQIFAYYLEEYYGII